MMKVTCYFLALLCKSILLLMILTIDASLKIDQLYLPGSILVRLTFLFVGFFNLFLSFLVNQFHSYYFLHIFQ